MFSSQQQMIVEGGKLYLPTPSSGDGVLYMNPVYGFNKASIDVFGNSRTTPPFCLHFLGDESKIIGSWSDVISLVPINHWEVGTAYPVNVMKGIAVTYWQGIDVGSPSFNPSDPGTPLPTSVSLLGSGMMVLFFFRRLRI